MATRISSPYVLLVEGQDELNVFSRIRSLLDFDALQIIDVGGQNKFGPTLEALARQGSFARIRVLGIVRDCEEDGEAVFQSVQGSLRSIGAVCPARRGEVAGDTQRVLVELLPPAGSTGCLETLFVAAAEQLETERCHQELARCVRNLPHAVSFTQARLDKIAALAIMSSYRSRYHTSVGLALQSEEFRGFLDAPPMRPLWAIVEKLHELSQEVA
jgi:hypothetical protein